MGNVHRARLPVLILEPQMVIQAEHQALGVSRRPQRAGLHNSKQSLVVIHRKWAELGLVQPTHCLRKCMVQPMGCCLTSGPPAINVKALVHG